MNKRFLNLLASNYIWWFGAGLLGPLYAVFAEKIGGDILELTGAYALYLILAGILSIYIGHISDHHSKKYLLLAGCSLNALATFGYLLVDSPLKLFMVQGLFGISAALSYPAWDSLFTMSLEKKHLGAEWGLSEGGPLIVSGIAILLGGLIITYFSFTVLFITMGIVQVIGTIVQSRILKFKD